MGGYAVNFTVYIMAMVGLICFAVFVYKKVMDGSIGGKKHTKFIEIEDTLSLNPRKSLHVIRAGNEKFLIASDFDRTSLISKLDAQQTNNFKKLPNCCDEGIIDYPSPKQLFKDTIKFVEQQQNIPQNKDKQRVHLEPIVRKDNRVIGISNLRKPLDYRAGGNQQPVKKAQQQQRPTAKHVPTPQKIKKMSATSTMKDMAKKINEL